MSILGKAFSANVANGELKFQESLADLEGQRVIVTLNAYSAVEATEERLPLLPTEPDELDLERDVSFQMPFQWETMKSSIADAGMLTPCVILPGEYGDE